MISHHSETNWILIDIIEDNVNKAGDKVKEGAEKVEKGAEKIEKEIDEEIHEDDH